MQSIIGSITRLIIKFEDHHYELSGFEERCYLRRLSAFVEQPLTTTTQMTGVHV